MASRTTERMHRIMRYVRYVSAPLPPWLAGMVIAWYLVSLLDILVR